jgi:hypothetical protein
MFQTPKFPMFRWFGGAALALSLPLAGCDDHAASPNEPMRSMQESPLPKVTAKALTGSADDEPSDVSGATNSQSAEPTPGEAPATGQREPKASVTAKAPPEAEGDQFSVKRLVLTHGIRDKEPVPTQSFAGDGTPVFAFVELSNPLATDAEIEIVFEHESGRRVGFVKLDVPGQQQRWRTWGQTRQIRQHGRWDAVVRTEDGQELMRTSFAVDAG